MLSILGPEPTFYQKDLNKHTAAWFNCTWLHATCSYMLALVSYNTLVGTISIFTTLGCGQFYIIYDNVFVFIATMHTMKIKENIITATKGTVDPR